MKILNTLTNKKEEFIPLTPGKVNIYACGVTVYDHCHIGHARSLYIFEVMRRYLRHKGYEVKFVRNITDVDDKIISKARIWAKENNISLWEAFDKVRLTYIESYYSDLKRLNIEKADHEPKATENITEMVGYIKVLIDKGAAYQAGGSVYFSVRGLPQYGQLSGKKIDQLLESVRIDSDANKRDPLDFALWKQAKDDEPSWDSPWGRGRPGWHIECSVMSQKYLKVNTLDIHGGGMDLVFPHHENERAQSEAYSGFTFARFWIHHGLLTINKQKMAKSLGNFLTISAVLDKCPADVLKLFYLQAHYSSSIDFSWDRIEEAKKAYERVIILTEKLNSYLNRDSFKNKKPCQNYSPSPCIKAFQEAMDDDFNMPRALAVLFEAVNESNCLFTGENNPECERLGAALEVIESMLDVFGFDLKKQGLDSITEAEIERQISQRAEFKNKKDFSAADKIRDELLEKGILLEDTKEGTLWRKKI